jgi:hypothetical protein
MAKVKIQERKYLSAMASGFKEFVGLGRYSSYAENVESRRGDIKRPWCTLSLALSLALSRRRERER